MYDALGAKVTVVEMLDQLMTGADPDLVRVAGQADRRALRGRADRYAAWKSVKAQKNGPQGGDRRRRRADLRPGPGGRRPRAQRQRHRRRGGRRERRRARVHRRRSTRCGPTSPASTPSATSSAGRCWPTRPPTRRKVAAEVIAGENVRFDARTIPSVAYTDPEVAWMGLTETTAKADGVEYEKSASRGRPSAAPSASAAPRA